jgi:hypothetical protein
MRASATRSNLEWIVLMDYGGNVEAKWICYGDELLLATGD